MGFNATVVVLADALQEIRTDPDFGKNLAAAIQKVANNGKPITIGVGNHGNPVEVVEVHHADMMKAIVVGGNCGIDLGYVGGYRSSPEAMLKQLASEMGFNISKKRKP